MARFLLALQHARGIRPGTARMDACLRRLGSPQAAFATVHVVGTKGKGSTAAMLHAILRAQGIVAALYTSPHLIDFTERFRVGDADVSWDDLAAAFREVHLATRGGADPPLTFFEWCTAMAFVLFARRGVKVAVVEAGMGGRWDATRSAAGQLVLVTRIGLDHTEQLGRTPERIAIEKASIMAPGATVLTARQLPDVENVIRRVVRRRGGACRPADSICSAVPHGTDVSGVCFDLLLAGGGRLYRLHIPLPGLHQAGNAALAAAGARVLAERGTAIGEEAIRTGLATVRWPGRLEILGDGPGVLLDGAHNRDSAEVLAAFLAEAFPGERLALVLGILADKDVQAILGALGRLPVRVYAAPCPNPRTLPAEVLAAEARKAGLPVAGVHRSVTAALDAARLHAGGAAPVVVTGSLYAVAEARARLLGRTIPHPFTQ